MDTTVIILGVIFGVYIVYDVVKGEVKRKWYKNERGNNGNFLNDRRKNYKYWTMTPYPVAILINRTRI